MLWMKDTPAASLVIRGARVVDPVEGIDATLDVRIDDGMIAAIGEHVDANGHRVIEGAGLVLAPAFVDPHVHLRTPGREDEETIATGTAAAAAGGYCAILAMPNTDPVVDSAAALQSLIEGARRDAVVPTGFMAAITRGQAGEELTEMGELADTGAAAFSDDGVPVRSAGLLQRALQYSSITGRPLALHEEEPTLTKGAHMHLGRTSAELGLAGYPSVGESVMVERDLSLAAAERQPLHLMHLSAAESVAALRRAREAGVRASGEVTPHHLVLTDDAVRSLDPNVKMNPPLREEDDRIALLDALRDGTIECVATDHAPHARHEKDVPFEAAPNGVIGLETAFAALYTHLVKPGALPLATLLERMSSGAARVFGLDRPRVAAGARANLVLLDLERDWQVADFRSKSRNSWLLGQTLTGTVVMTIANGAVVHDVRRPSPTGAANMTGFVALADGTVWRGESVGGGGFACGEAVFTTGMSGYQEAVTDPSFAEQIICFTAPMVGNYGVADGRSESRKAQARAVLMREARGPAWTDWLHEHGVAALTGVDTRSLVLHIREAGAMQACVVTGDATSVEEAVATAAGQPSMEGRALVADVSTPEPYDFTTEGRVRVAVVDYGVKRSVLRRLANAGAKVRVFPHEVDVDTVAGYDGVLLSPGPGDPAPLAAQTEMVGGLVGRTDVLGICLGHQLLAMATGHETFKLPFGHRGTNHPVLERTTGRVLVTSQNHGFAVRASDAKEISHHSLYDETVEGLTFPGLRARSAQFHPEAGPGPHDAWIVLDEWVAQLA